MIGTYDPRNDQLVQAMTKQQLAQRRKLTDRYQTGIRMGQAALSDQQPVRGWGDALANISKSIAGGYAIRQGHKGLEAEQAKEDELNQAYINQKQQEAEAQRQQAQQNWAAEYELKKQAMQNRTDGGAGSEPLKIGSVPITEFTTDSIAEAQRTNDVTKLVRIQPTPKADEPRYGKYTKDQVGMLSEQQEKYQADPRVKQHQGIQPLVTNARAADDTKVGDEALVKTFSKLTDPNTGVLQGEAEALYGTTLRGLYAQARGFFDNGQRIPPEVRASLLSNIDRLAGGIRENYDAATGEYGARLEQRGIPSSELLPRSNQSQQQSTASAAPQPQRPPETGETYTDKDGNIRRKR